MCAEMLLQSTYYFQSVKVTKRKKLLLVFVFVYMACILWFIIYLCQQMHIYIKIL